MTVRQTSEPARTARDAVDAADAIVRRARNGGGPDQGGGIAPVVAMGLVMTLILALVVTFLTNSAAAVVAHCTIHPLCG